jgi:hypothetical protein
MAQIGAINPWCGNGTDSFPLMDNVAWLRDAWGL